MRFESFFWRFRFDSYGSNASPTWMVPFFGVYLNWLSFKIKKLIERVFSRCIFQGEYTLVTSFSHQEALKRIPYIFLKLASAKNKNTFAWPPTINIFIYYFVNIIWAKVFYAFSYKKKTLHNLSGISCLTYPLIKNNIRKQNVPIWYYQNVSLHSMKKIPKTEDSFQ